VNEFIREWLESTETGGAFDHCTKCACELEPRVGPWTVTKEWHRGECIMEYALCHPCRGEMVSSISAESLTHVEGFFERRVDLSHWLATVMTPDDPAGLIEKCFACGTPRGECEGFGISAMFSAAGTLDLGPLPLLVCHNCSAALESGLSKQTRDSWQRFVEENFPGPPGHGEPVPHARIPAIF
jgi:hypothetical protein